MGNSTLKLMEKKERNCTEELVFSELCDRDNSSNDYGIPTNFSSHRVMPDII